MAITTLADAIAGQQPRDFFIRRGSGGVTGNYLQSLWSDSVSTAGYPVTGSFDNTLNGVILSSTSAQVNGQLRFFNPASGNAYLSQVKFNCETMLGAQVMICDRLWHNGGYTMSSTSAQNSTTPTWPARDINESTDGDGVYLALETTANSFTSTPTITVSYTNSAGTGSRTGTNIVPVISSSAMTSFIPIGLQAGDTGVRSVQSLTFSSSSAGSPSVALVAYRLIGTAVLNQRFINGGDDVLTIGMPRVYNGSVPFIVLKSDAATTGTLTGHYRFTNG